MKKRHGPEQIVRKLRQADQMLASGASVPEVARELGMSEASYCHRWGNRYGRMNLSETKRLKGAPKGERPPEEAPRRSRPGPPEAPLSYSGCHARRCYGSVLRPRRRRFSIYKRHVRSQQLLIFGLFGRDVAAFNKEHKMGAPR